MIPSMLHPSTSTQHTLSKMPPKILLQFVYSSLLPLLQHRPPHLITPLPLTYKTVPQTPLSTTTKVLFLKYNYELATLLPKTIQW